VPLNHEEPLAVAAHLFIERDRHFEPLQALSALALAQEDVARRIARWRAVGTANLLVDLPQQCAAFADDVDR
jgi:hypothetical protein